MQKLYYSISEVSQMIDEEQHILRYWEKEFDQLNPKKNRAGNRIYSEKDINILKLIKKLLREEKLSLRGAKENLNKYDLDTLEEDLFSHIEQNDQAKLFDGVKSSNLPPGSVVAKKQDIESIYTFYKEMRHFLINLD